MNLTAICPAYPDNDGAERPLCDQKFIVRSNTLSLSRCRCGRYWLTSSGDRHPAEGYEQALAEIIESLARLKLPGAVMDGRRA